MDEPVNAVAPIDLLIVCLLARLAPIAPTRLGMLFVDGAADDAAAALGLAPADSRSNGTDRR